MMDEKEVKNEQKAVAPPSDSGRSVDDATNKPAEAAKSSAYWRVFTLSDKKDVLLLLAAFIAACGSGASLALVNIVIGGFVNIVSDFNFGRASPAEFRSQSGTYALRFVYLFIARYCLSYIYTAALTISGTRISRKLRARFLYATLSQDIAYFDGGGNGAVSVMITTNGNLVQQGISEKLGTTIQAIAAFTAAFIVAVATQWKLALITITIAPAIIIVTVGCFAVDAKIESKVLAIYAKAGVLAEDVISSIKNVAAFSAGPKLLNKYDEQLAAAHKIAMKKSPIYGTLFSCEFFMVFAGFALAFWQGIHRYASGEISDPGTIVTVLFSVIIAATSMTQVAPNITAFTNAASAAAALFATIDRRSEINAMDEGGVKLESLQGELILDNVNFSYPTRPDVQVLFDFSLRIPMGKTTALVGASGSGKSTIIGLLERWYNPGSGSIILDGHPIESLNLMWLRTNIRLVQQEPVLFSGTVFDNVCYGLTGTAYEDSPEDVKRKLVREACQIAYADEFITELPEGYDTEVGERAGLLSGGQKQRITIARSIVSNPKVLLLDEATSALDPNAEGIVQRALERAAENRTTVTIAHKLATIQHADNIVVMGKGKIIEQGTYQELLAADGAFARLVRVQNLESDARSTSENESDDGPRDTSKLAALRTTNTKESQAGVREDTEDDLDFDLYKQTGFLSTTFRLLREQKGQYFLFAMMFVTCCAGGATYPAQALLFAELMEVFSLTGDRLLDRGDFFSLMFFIVALGNLIVYFILGWSANLVSQQATHLYRRDIFRTLLRQDVRFFDRSENNVGSITSRLSSQPTHLMELIGFNLALIVIIIVNLLSSCILAISYGWKLGLVMSLGGLPPLVASGFIRMRLELRMANESAKLFSESAALASEAVGSIRTVVSLALEKRFMNRFEEKMSNIIKISVPKILVSSILMAWTQSIEFLILALGFWYGCRLVSYGEYSMKTFYIVFIATFFSGQAASQFFQYTTSITKAVGAANYIFWLRSRTPRIGETDENKDRGPKDGSQSLALDHVKFSYPLRPDVTVLRGVSLNIKPGEFVAFVGGSGCGKSTLISLLERFYDPTSGSILLNSTPVPLLNPRLYRSQMALVQQEPTLYQGSIRENITLGLNRDDHKSVSDDVVNEACRQANVYDFVSSLPEGLHTPCGTRGLSLSGGQRQRIAIARSLIRRPKILLLDEATSALDSESEKIVQDALADAAASEERITVAVAHRLSTIKEAHKIFVFSEGKIAEAGSHDQLFAERGLYYEMCMAQALDKAM